MTIHTKEKKTQNYMIFNCGVILTYRKYICILSLATLKMAT
jgi:hypothetical protein